MEIITSKVKQSKALHDTAVEILHKAGFIDTPDKWLDMAITTAAGALRVRVEQDSLVRGRPVSVTLYMQFDDPKAAAAAGFGCNPYSGKYNHHFLTDTAGIDAVLAGIA